MRAISVAYTKRQIRTRRKFVTRRMGFLFTKAGDLLQPVEKAQGLKKGEKVVHVGGPIRVVNVRRERLNRMTEDPAYGRDEVRLEGFEGHKAIGTPEGFVAFFCELNGCSPRDFVTRIEFEYTTRQEPTT